MDRGDRSGRLTYSAVDADLRLRVRFVTSPLAGVFTAQGRYEQAEPLYERSLSILEKELGPRHPDVAKTLEFYATTLQMLGRGAEADRLDARAKAIVEGRAEDNQEN